ncbi:MAG: hypothetical protein HFE49_07530 [Clostridia bacterium]|nr:hypothetical protein [Clostridia bacterium]
MKTFEVKYSVDGKSGFSTIVSAPNSATARKVALGKVQGQAGYIGKKVRISAAIEIR